MLSARIAQDLLVLGAVTLRPDNPFTWASGLKAPIYCDNRLTMGDVAVRRRITEGFTAVIREHNLSPDVIAGTATAGIPHAAWLAHALDLPMVYVRSKAKSHGRENMIEGRLGTGSEVVLVEDTISTGMSSLSAVKALREAEVEVQALIAIYTYGFDQAAEAFKKEGVPVFALTEYEALIEAASDMRRIDKNDAAALRAWRDDPQEWSDERTL